VSTILVSIMRRKAVKALSMQAKNL
jgi:hypothetical protein